MPKIRYLHKTRREIPGIYARNPSIILQNMNFSRYYRYRAQLIYSFDLNIIPFDIEEFLQQLDGLLEDAYKNKDDMKERVQKVVTTYHPA